MTTDHTPQRRRRASQLSPDLQRIQPPAPPIEPPSSQATAAQTAPQRSAGDLPGVAIGLLALTALGVLAIVSNTRSDPAAAPALTPTSVLPTAVVATPQPAVARTACPSLSAWNELLAGYERRGQWRLAASSTETALRTPGLCAADRQTLANKLVAVTSETLFLDPAPPEDARDNGAPRRHIPVSNCLRCGRVRQHRRRCRSRARRMPSGSTCWRAWPSATPLLMATPL